MLETDEPLSLSDWPLGRAAMLCPSGQYLSVCEINYG